MDEEYRLERIEYAIAYDAGVDRSVVQGALSELGLTHMKDMKHIPYGTFCLTYERASVEGVNEHSLLGLEEKILGVYGVAGVERNHIKGNFD